MNLKKKSKILRIFLAYLQIGRSLFWIVFKLHCSTWLYTNCFISRFHTDLQKCKMDFVYWTFLLILITFSSYMREFLGLQKQFYGSVWFEILCIEKRWSYWKVVLEREETTPNSRVKVLRRGETQKCQKFRAKSENMSSEITSYKITHLWTTSSSTNQKPSGTECTQFPLFSVIQHAKYGSIKVWGNWNSCQSMKILN